MGSNANLIKPLCASPPLRINQKFHMSYAALCGLTLPPHQYLLSVNGNSVWVWLLVTQKANKQVSLVERKVCFICRCWQLGVVWGARAYVQRLTPQP